MRYVRARFEKDMRERTYRIYVSDCLYALVNGGLELVHRYADIIDPAPKKKTDERTQEEIVAQVWRGITGR